MKLEKNRGGFKVDWIGLHVNYVDYSVGLSEARVRWVINWVNQVPECGKVSTRDMAGALGRLGFAATALIYEKAFLGLLYAWTGAILRQDRDTVTVPWAIRLILQWLKTRLEGPGRLQAVPRLALEGGDLFRSDAKAEDGIAVVGGWDCSRGQGSKVALWFSFKVTAQWAPWAYAKANDPQRVIATLELLGTLLSIMLFSEHWDKGLHLRCGQADVLQVAADGAAHRAQRAASHQGMRVGTGLEAARGQRGGGRPDQRGVRQV